jgi:hypothetical protein
MDGLVDCRPTQEGKIELGGSVRIGRHPGGGPVREAAHRSFGQVRFGSVRFGSERCVASRPSQRPALMSTQPPSMAGFIIIDPFHWEIFPVELNPKTTSGRIETSDARRTTP